MRENINLSINIERLDKINPLISRYKCNVAAVDVKANSYLFHKDILQKMIPTLKGSPILTYYSDLDDKFAGHEGDYYSTKGRIIRTPELSAIGFVDYVSEPTFEFINNEEWLTCVCYLWDGRFSFLRNISERTNIFQSMEVVVDYEELSDGTKIVTDAILIGLALIGIDPAFEGSTFKSFSNKNIQDEVNKLKQEFESFASKYDDLDFSIPSGVKESTKLGLELYKKHNKGGTSVSLANARFIQKNDVVTPEKIKSINKYCIRMASKDFNKDDESDSNWISFNLWGASEGYSWSNKLVEAMNKRDEEKMSYFALNNETMISSEVINDIKNNEEGENVIKEAVEKFSLNSDQIREILRNALSEFKYTVSDYEYNKYYVDCYDAEYVYVWDNEDDKTYRMEYNINDLVATINVESKAQVVHGGYVPVEQQTEQMSEEKSEGMSTEEMAKEDNNTDDKDNKEDMSSNDYVDNTAMQAMNENSAENNEELSNEMLNKENQEKEVMLATLQEEMSACKEKMSKMEADLTVYMDENTKLKEFKASIEKQNKEFAVETTLKEVMDVLPKEEIEACRLSSEKFSLEDIDSWKNEVKAKAFNFSKGLTEKKTYIQVGFPTSEKPKGKGLWD